MCRKNDLPHKEADKIDRLKNKRRIRIRLLPKKYYFASEELFESMRNKSVPRTLPFSYPLAYLMRVFHNLPVVN